MRWLGQLLNNRLIKSMVNMPGSQLWTGKQDIH